MCIKMTDSRVLKHPNSQLLCLIISKATPIKILVRRTRALIKYVDKSEICTLSYNINVIYQRHVTYICICVYVNVSTGTF